MARLGKSGAERCGEKRRRVGPEQSGAVRNGGAGGQSRVVWNGGAARAEWCGTAAHGARAEQCGDKRQRVGPERSGVVRYGTGVRGVRARGQSRAVRNGGASGRVPSPFNQIIRTRTTRGELRYEYSAFSAFSNKLCSLQAEGTMSGKSGFGLTAQSLFVVF